MERLLQFRKEVKNNENKFPFIATNNDIVI